MNFMAQFTNYATLTYTGGTASSNTVTGELVDLTQITKTALTDTYSPGDTVVYVLSLRNTGESCLNNLTLTDDLGGYAFGTGTVYPLAYQAGSLRYFVNGTQQAAPTVTAGPPLVISGLSVPAGGSSLLIYQTTVTAYAPLDTGSTIVNTATLTGTGISNAQTAQETVTVRSGPALAITKALSPSTVTENSRITYTFVIQNTGNTAAAATDNIVVSDTFSPALRDIQVTFNGTAWTAGTQFTYNQTTGLFTTTAGSITVPAATITQSTDGTFTTAPGTATLTVTGTI